MVNFLLALINSGVVQGNIGHTITDRKSTRYVEDGGYLTSDNQRVLQRIGVKLWATL